MDAWRAWLRVDPLPALLGSSPAVRYFARRDLLCEPAGPIEALWSLREPAVLLGQQLPTGAWAYRGRKPGLRAGEDYAQIETFRALGQLVEKYGFDRRHRAVQRAAAFVFSRQTAAGDIRGIYGRQYTPNYCAAFLELLIKAGYACDARVERGLQWLLAMRQDDGGWAIPLRTAGRKLDAVALRGAPIEPDRARPSSHLATGVALRAFAAHPRWRHSREARAAGQLLAERLFAPDAYPDRRAPGFWLSFSFPFWFTDLLSALDALAWLGFGRRDGNIGRAVEWFIDHQRADGLWALSLLRMTREPDRDAWISLAIARALKQLDAAEDGLR